MALSWLWRSTLVVMLAVGVPVASTCVLPQAAHADSWIPPKTESYTSPNGRFRLTVLPREIGSALQYFEAKVRHGEASEGHATGKFAEKDANGVWRTRWERSLTNEVAPVAALVSNNGDRFVVFDNWHAMGYGPNTVVVHDGQGAVVRSLSLQDILPADYVRALPRSVSSIRWGGEHRLSEDGLWLVLQVVVPGAGQGSDVKRYVPVEISLADGSIIPPQGSGWEAALSAARAVATRQDIAEHRRIAFLTEPLVGPRNNEERAWHDYLREAFLRLTPDYLDMPVTSTTVLRDPKAHDYKPSEGWVIDEFVDAKENPGDIAIASPASGDNLVRVLAEAAARIRPGTLRQSTLYIVVDSLHRDAASAAIARTGVKVVWLDPAVPIPQRPERVPGSDAERLARAEIERRQNELFDVASDH